MAQGAAAQWWERLPDFDAVRADDALHARRGQLHGAYDRRQIHMSCEHEFGTPSSRAQSGCDKSRLAVRRAREDKFALANTHAVQFLRVVQAQHAVFHLPGGGKFAENERHVAAGPLDTAGCVEFWEQSDEHAVSLTNPRGRMQVLR